MFSLSEFRKIEEAGVHFRNHLNGDKLFLSPLRRRWTSKCAWL
ncbi:hypothetical protein ACEQPO_20445 [Bacillus sp. SL00103]